MKKVLISVMIDLSAATVSGVCIVIIMALIARFI